ncbi:MAG: aquaporin [Alphaproteobacteria bacterium]
MTGLAEPAARSKVAVRPLAAEALGSALLAAAVVGSGIMGETLAGGNAALALIGNTGATAAILVVLITLLGPISGAHFNPTVTFVFVLRREIAWPRAVLYAAMQVAGCILGTILAHLMFEQPLVEFSMHARAGPAQWLSEFIATFALVLVILGLIRKRPAAVPGAVALTIAAGYWFTASTSFANPAITIARALTNTFSGIAPADVPGFIAAQFAGAAAGLMTANYFGWRRER